MILQNSCRPQKPGQEFQKELHRKYHLPPLEAAGEGRKPRETERGQGGYTRQRTSWAGECSQKRSHHCLGGHLGPRGPWGSGRRKTGPSMTSGSFAKLQARPGALSEAQLFFVTSHFVLWSVQLVSHRLSSLSCPSLWPFLSPSSSP